MVDLLQIFGCVCVWLFIYISKVVSLHLSPLQAPYPLFPCLCEGTPPTHLLPPHHPSIPICWAIEPLQEQGPPLPVIPHQAVL